MEKVKRFFNQEAAKKAKLWEFLVWTFLMLGVGVVFGFAFWG